MTVEEIMVERENYDKFPIGLRVLAVDDDAVCLKLLENLLRKCQYHVTTTSQARMALEMLRENKDRFDVVISDVHMPDMDGFKLLELVGLEMDLPVIMLSGNSDPKLVMKGVTHGACDYLVKPVRIEELRNIWQHVLRRKKFDPKNQNTLSTDIVKSHPGSGEGHESSPVRGDGDENVKFSRKRKEEDDESEDNNGEESEDPSSQKKPRVVWSIELHRKFVAAVNQLGIEKSVPKRILDMMNVEGLTRENVASHLQKYRLYLKRISSVATQQANMAAAALGVKDSPFMHMGSLDGMGDFRTLSVPGRLANGLSPYAANGMLSRLNSSSNINLRNLTPSTLIQPNHSQNMSNSITGLGKMQPVFPPSTQNPSLFQGIPSSLELDQLQQNKGTAGILNFNAIDESRMFTNTFMDPGAAIGSSSNSLNNTTNNSLMLNPSPNNMSSFNSESFNTGSSNLQPNSLLYTEAFHTLNSVRDNNSLNAPYLQNNPIDISSTSVPLQDSCQENFQNFNQKWGGSNNVFGSFNSHTPLSRRIMDQNSRIFNQKMDGFLNGRSGGGDALMHMQQTENEKSVMTESRTRSNENFPVERPKFQGGFVPQSYDSMDELMNSMSKLEQDGSIPNCDFGFDDYSFGQGI